MEFDSEPTMEDIREMVDDLVGEEGIEIFGSRETAIASILAILVSDLTNFNFFDAAKSDTVPEDIYEKVGDALKLLFIAINES